MPSQSPEAKKRQSERFKKWYEAHKEEIRAKRRQRYHSDPEYRHRVKLSTRRYYWRKKRKLHRLALDRPTTEAPVAYYPADSWIHIKVEDPEDVRHGMEFPIPVYFVGTISRVVNRTAQVIRVWEEKGVLPPATYRDAKRQYRLYTWEQFAVIMRHRWLLSAVGDRLTDSAFRRYLTAEWQTLSTQGLARMPNDRWRITDEACPVCHRQPGLRYRNDDGEWVDVPCFACCAPWHGPDRLQTGRFELVRVEHICKQCGATFSVPAFVEPGETVWMTCPQCGALHRQEILVEKAAKLSGEATGDTAGAVDSDQAGG